MKNKKKFWNFRNSLSGTTAELLLYGDIAEESWLGDETTPLAFKAELDALAGQDILVRINSRGGDVFAAHAIYNLLKSYKGNVTAIVDGLAASAATIVMMAASKVTVPSNALIMIHNPQSYLSDYYDANALDAMSAALKTITGTILDVYKKKCGDKCGEKKLKDLMDNQQWLTSDEALQYGFADSVENDVKVDMFMNQNAVFVNHVRMENIPNVQALIKAGYINQNTDQEEHIMNLEELKTKYPGLCKDLEDQAAKAALTKEQERLAALDALHVDGNNIIQKIIDKAKTSGKTAAEIKDYIDILAAVKPAEETKPVDNAAKFVNDLITGNKASGVDAVKGNPGGETDAQEQLDAVNYMVNRMKA